jgi:hypothetical protein
LFAIAHRTTAQLEKLRAMKKFLPWMFAVVFLFWLGTTLA